MQLKKFDSINVVPFIDIMLVLLVIVLTTASFVAKGMIPLELSTSKSSTKIEEEKNLTISIKENGEIFFDKTAIEFDKIESILHKYPLSTPIHIECDKEAKFDIFVKLLDILKQNDYKNFGIITQKE